MIKQLAHLPKETIDLFLQRGLEIAKVYHCPCEYNLNDYYTLECKEGNSDAQCKKCWKEALKVDTK